MALAMVQACRHPHWKAMWRNLESFGMPRMHRKSTGTGRVGGGRTGTGKLGGGFLMSVQRTHGLLHTKARWAHIMLQESDPDLQDVLLQSTAVADGPQHMADPTDIAAAADEGAAAAEGAAAEEGGLPKREATAQSPV